jgi:hypothetical protein
VDARTNRHAGTVSALVARQRGRARLRAAAAAVAGASLIGAGVVAYHLPSIQATASGQTASTAANSRASGTAVHATSGDSGVAASTSTSGTQSGTAPAASSGTSHVTSGGS